MSTFNNSSVTMRGAVIIASLVAGGTLTFTRIAVGDGNLPSGKNPMSMTGLANRLFDVPIQAVDWDSESKATVKGSFSNKDLATGFWYREIGLYCLNPDTGEEELYCYGNAGDEAEYISPAGESSLIEKEVHLVTLIGNATEVTALFDDKTLALKSEVDAALALKADLDATDAEGGRVVARQMRLDADQILYVDASAAAGGDGSEVQPFKSIQAAIDARYLGAAVIYIKIKPGTYAEKLNIPRSPGTTWRFERNGDGVISVQGGLIDNCAYVVMDGLTFNMTDSDPDSYCLHFANVGNSNLANLVINGKSNKTAIHFNNSKCRLTNSVINYAGVALAASDSSLVYAYKTSGISNVIGVHSAGATIITSDQTLQAETLYVRESNGVINPASWQYISDGTTDVTTLPSGIYTIRNGKMGQGLPADYDGTLIVDTLTGHPHMVFYYDAMTRVFHRNYNVNGGIWNEWEEYAPPTATPSTFGLMRVAAVEDEQDCTCTEAAITPANFADMGDYRQANTSYAVGAVVRCLYHAELILECTTAGRTSKTALDTRGVTAGQVVTDGTVKWTVRAPLEEFLKLIGGVMTGPIEIDVPDYVPVIKREGVNSFWMRSDGAFVFRAAYDESADFWIHPDGRIIFAQKNLARSVFGVDADTAGNVDGTLVTASSFFVQRSVNDSFLMVSGGNNYLNGAYLQLYGGDHSSGGAFTLSAGKDGAYQLIGNPQSGNLYWKGQRIVSSPDIIAQYVDSGGWTLPAGGTWAYIVARDDANLSGLAAGGTTINVASRSCCFAIRKA